MTDFEEYIKQCEPDKQEKAIIWQTAIGLQQTDGLKTSAYLVATAKQNIDGNINFYQVKKRIDEYYKTHVTDVTNNVTDVTDRLSQILLLIEADNRTSTAKMAEILSVSKRTILRDIEKLKQAGKIRREGSERTGYWKIL